MDNPHDLFIKKLLVTFKVEAEEHLQAIISGLMELEKSPAVEKQAEIIEAIFRETHSLKGAARTVNQERIETICQSIESVFSSLKRKAIPLSPFLFDTLHEAIDILDKFVDLLGQQTGEKIPNPAEIIQKLKSVAINISFSDGLIEAKKSEPEIPPVSKAESFSPLIKIKPAMTETVRISTTRLNSLFLQVEELIFAKLATARHITDLREINIFLDDWKKEWIKSYPDLSAFQRGLEKTDLLNPIRKRQLTKLQEYLEWNHHHAQDLESRMAALTAVFEQDHLIMGRMIDNLLGDMKKISMFPFQSLLEIFPKLVRDLSRDQGKEVELIIQGGEIEIDRRILEEIKDSFIHMVRNCVDHGIETPEERLRKMKAPRGVITLSISQIGSGRVEMCISDDGAGIDNTKVRAAAVKLGILSSQTADTLNEPSVHALIFHSGVSTSPVITDISGRGLGLAIVREKVENLGGSVSIESQLDVGTTFRIVLPLTLATYRGITVRVEERLFVIPITHVERVLRINPNEIQTVENQETIEMEGQVISLVRLGEVLGMSSRSTLPPPYPILLLHCNQKQIAFLVDEILQEQEILVKSLGPQLTQVKNIEGATILGAGMVIPILHVPDLMESALHSRTASSPAGAVEKAATRQSILVAEDSITSRTLLKNILETAGYEVKTAVDGMDAFTQLRTADFDLVVSDIEMPRMNGFELTAKIRSDKKLTELPVVLVTALQSREDRERGIESGANAYLVKSSFEQSNLLEIIRRLI